MNHDINELYAQYLDKLPPFIAARSTLDKFKIEVGSWYDDTELMTSYRAGGGYDTFGFTHDQLTALFDWADGEG